MHFVFKGETSWPSSRMIRMIRAVRIITFSFQSSRHICHWQITHHTQREAVVPLLAENVSAILRLFFFLRLNMNACPDNRIRKTYFPHEFFYTVSSRFYWNFSLYLASRAVHFRVVDTFACALSMLLLSALRRTCVFQQQKKILYDAKHVLREISKIWSNRLFASQLSVRFNLLQRFPFY